MEAQLRQGLITLLNASDSDALRLTKHALSIKSAAALRLHLTSLLSSNSLQARKLVSSCVSAQFPNGVGSNLEREVVKYVITGNEEGDVSISTIGVVNCLKCGFIYKIEDYRRLSICGFCEAPLSKKGRNAKKSDVATANKDTLVGFDKRAAERTKVLDDHSDYFKSKVDSVWSSEQEKEAATREKDALEAELAVNKRKIHIAIDAKSRSVVQVDPNLSKSAMKVYDALQQFR